MEPVEKAIAGILGGIFLFFSALTGAAIWESNRNALELKRQRIACEQRCPNSFIMADDACLCVTVANRRPVPIDL